MHVAVVGAGALGRILGGRLAGAEGITVDFVVRASKPPPEGPIVLERVHGGRDVLVSPSFVPRVPEHADVVLVCVRTNQLGEELVATLSGSRAVPVVVVTPMLTKTHERLRAAIGSRLTGTMLNAIGYTSGAGVTRYWISRATRLLLDEPRTFEPALTGLVKALGSVGIGAEFALGAHEVAAATTIAILPLVFGIDAAGSLDDLLRDRAIFNLTLEAIDESRVLADRCGKVASWAVPFFRFLGPYTARVGAALARRRSSEALGFVVDQFGRRARAQNIALAEETLALSHEKGVRHDALQALAAKLS